jgi:membrane protease YdiL (CAAX protease family)
VPRDHLQPDRAFRRRRLVVAVVLVLGTVLLGVSLSVRPGDPAFYWLTVALAAVWLVGGVASGPLHLGRIAAGGRLRRPVFTPIAIGLVFVAIFVLGALAVREIGPLADYTQRVLALARRGSLPLLVVITVLNGITEEVFFRGALYAAIGDRQPVLVSTVIYAVATVATGNPMLVFAALTLGAVLGLQRRASGGLLAPTLTHLTWSVSMLLVLPPLFAGR